MRGSHGFSGEGRCNFTYKRFSYTDLWTHEYLAIEAWWKYNDKSKLVDLIKRDWIESDAMREAIADIVSGKLSRPESKKSSIEYRDYTLSVYISDLLRPYTPYTKPYKTYKYLRSSRRNGVGAAEIAAAKYNEEHGTDKVTPKIAADAWEKYENQFPKYEYLTYE
jgi:hypothetical protein